MRNNTIDIAKGIGIFLIIISHSVYFGGFIHNWIFAFHVPLFFILSGLFFKEDNLLSLIKKKAKSLILPYFIFYLIGLTITLAIPQLRSHLTIYGICKDIYLGVPDNVHVSSVWFLMCLFFAMLILEALLLLKKKNVYISCILLVCIVVLGLSFGSFPKILSIFPAHRLPLDIDCACVALFFLWFGFFFKEKIFDKITVIEQKKSSWLRIALCVMLILSIILTILNKRVNLHGMTYNNWILYIVEAIVGFFLVILLSITVAHSVFLKKIFTWLGRNSLKIMGVQALAVRAFIFITNRITGQHFSLYMVSGWYALIDCVVSVAVSIVVVATFNYVIALIGKVFRTEGD